MSICFEFTVSKIQTLVDGGIRVTFDLPEQATDVAKQLMDLRGLSLHADISRTKTKALNGKKPKTELDLLTDEENIILESLNHA